MFVLKCDMCETPITNIHGPFVSTPETNCMTFNWESMIYREGETTFRREAIFPHGSLVVCNLCGKKIIEVLNLPAKTIEY